jgi:hypothetical protein
MINVRNVEANEAVVRRAARGGAKYSVSDEMRRISFSEDPASAMTQSVKGEGLVSQILALLWEQPSQGCRISNRNIPFPDKKSDFVKIAAKSSHEAFAFIGSCRGRYS